MQPPPDRACQPPQSLCKPGNPPSSFQQVILSLQQFWDYHGCILLQPYDTEVGAGTSSPATLLRALGRSPWRTAYVQPSRRPSDGRYGENPNRLQQYYQFQVLLKPAPLNPQELYLQSLAFIGLDLSEHDIRFVEDDWENPSLGASGIGWEVWCDGMEITQFTYFQQVGGMECEVVSAEITYGLERVTMLLQGVDNFFDIDWNAAVGAPQLRPSLPDSPQSLQSPPQCSQLPQFPPQPDSPPSCPQSLLPDSSQLPGPQSPRPDSPNISYKYKDVCLIQEREFSRYNFELASTTKLFSYFKDFEEECVRLIECGVVLPAYEQCLKANHCFNMLNARGVISVTERAGYISRVRALAKLCCEAWVRLYAQV
jgi:glycyl-tRNA synthetase alpha chain